MKSSQYWKNRSAKRMYEYHTEADKVADDIAQAYIDSTNYINNEIEKIFRTFQIEGGLTESEARELLNNTPGQVKLANLKDYIKQVKDPEKQQTLLNMINSPAYSYRIKRFERLQEDIDRQTRELAEFEQKTTKNHYVQLSGEAYNRTMFDIQRGIGFGFPFSKMPVSRIEEILKNNWSGQHFSARIWGRAEDINQILKEELLTQFMTGRSYRKTAAEISDRMAVGAYEARRLVRTESTYIANSAELESYKECGIEQFRFLATLDMRTSELCASMDGKVFSVEEGVPGTNIPPLHPWCRSTTVAVIDGAVLSDLKRRARDPETGKPYLVSADTTYEEWKKELDQRFGEGYSTTKRKMVQNRAKDSKQYQNYLSVLGKDNMPKSLDEFQNLKYNNTERWQFVKLDYSRQHRLIEHPELALPNAERVFIDDRKFTEYLFNPLNKKGYAKGKAIISRLGYDITNFDQLKKVVESSAFKYPSTFRSNNGYGDQYEQKIVLYGLKEKPANVIVGWIADGNDTKLTSLYIKER